MIKWKVEPLEELRAAGWTWYKIRRAKVFGESAGTKFRRGGLPSWEELNKFLNLTGLTIGEALEHISDETGKE